MADALEEISAFFNFAFVHGSIISNSYETVSAFGSHTKFGFLVSSFLALLNIELNILALSADVAQKMKNISEGRTISFPRGHRTG